MSGDHSRLESQPFLEIFIPKHFMHCTCHYVIGIYKCEHFHYQINCILAMFCEKTSPVSLNTNTSKVAHFVEELRADLNEKEKKIYTIECVGLILGVETREQLWKYKSILTRMENNVSCILQICNQQETMSVAYFHLKGMDLTHKCQARIILYSGAGLLSSQLLMSATEDTKTSSQTNADNITFLTLLVKSRIAVENKTLKYYVEQKCDKKDIFFPLEKRNKNNFIFYFINIFFTVLICVINICWNIFTFLQIRLPVFMKKILLQTDVGRQINRRFHHISYLSEELDQNKTVSLRAGNLMFAILLDVIAGCFATYLIFHYVQLNLLLDSAVTYADEVVNKLQNLLYWLMGVPAGLKLNFPLSAALGHFFLYHIYLWKTYMAIIKPVFAFVIESFSILGFLGLTFLISLFSDLISLATIHIYCFYGYATRLYGFQIFGLASLWRLFRGMKWNPLRQRVDSFTYDVYQLFIGTLLFTVLFFLLPTVLIYYLVFSMLRVIVLLIQGLIIRTVHLLSICPVYTTVLWALGSNVATGSVKLVPCSNQNTDTKSVILDMKVVHTSLGSLIAETVPKNHKPLVLWRSLLQSLLLGEIIYPL